MYVPAYILNVVGEVDDLETCAKPSPWAPERLFVLGLDHAGSPIENEELREEAGVHRK